MAPLPPQSRDRVRSRLITPIASIGLALLGSCEVVDSSARLPGVDHTDTTRALVGQLDTSIDPSGIDFLLSMSYPEAVEMASQSMEVPPFFRVAADDITHPRLQPGQHLTAFKATGNVFLEINFAEPIIALAHEADVDIQQVVLRGRPVLRRGMSVIEGTSQKTVFYVTSRSIDIDGPHLLRRIGDRFDTSDDDEEGPANLSPDQPDNAPGIDPGMIPEGMTAEEIQRIISG